MLEVQTQLKSVGVTVVDDADPDGVKVKSPFSTIEISSSLSTT